MHRTGSILLVSLLSVTAVVAACSPAAPASASASSSPSSPSPAPSAGAPTPVTGGAASPGAPIQVGGGTAGPIGPADIAAASAAWSAVAPAAYQLRVRFGCECLLGGSVVATVRDGAVVSVQQDGRPIDMANVQGFPLTVDAILKEAQATLDGGGTVKGAFSASGVPATLDLDRDLQAVDDELHIEIAGVDPID